MTTVLIVLGLALVLATILPFVNRPEWWIRCFDYPRTQIAVALAALIAAFLLVGKPGRIGGILFLLVLLLCLAYQLFRILPYTPLVKRQVLASADRDPSARIRLLIANVLMDNRQSGAFLDIVRAADPDLILAAETDARWDHALSALDRDYPFAVKHPLGNTYGMHLFSRLELGAPAVKFLIEDDIPSIHTGVRLRDGRSIDFYGLHPRPPAPSQDTEERDAELLIVGRMAKARPRPAIVAGDLNDVAWSHTTRLFQRISGLLDPRVGRGLFATFNANWPLARWPLDHVFHDSTFKLGKLERLGYFGSDHFPMLIELRYDPAARVEQDAPSTEPGDRPEAERKIRDGTAAGST